MAATILPFSSEIAFVAAIKNDMPLFNALVFASSGNILAIVLNYYLGYFLYEKMHIKLEKSKVGNKSLHYGQKYGYLALLLSWLPIIGDPLTIVAGLVRLKFIYFLLIAGVLRIIRYIFISYLL